MVKNIYILCGGISVEHEISLRSAQSVINALDRDKYNLYPVYIGKDGSWTCLDKVDSDFEKPEDLIVNSDLGPAQSLGEFLTKDYKSGEDNFFIPILHGTNGEDGVVQGFFEMLDVPYMGNGVLASAACMDKIISNNLFEAEGIPQAKYLGLIESDYRAEPEKYQADILEMGLPVFVKPANAGSSVGVMEASSEDELEKALENAFIYDSRILIEESVQGRELEIAVMGNDHPLVSLPGEHEVQTQAFFDYESKYLDSTTVIKAPTEVEPEIEDRARKLAEKSYKALACQGLARVDIFLRGEELLVNEINTLPGMTSISLFPMLWKPTADMEIEDVLEKLIEYGLEAYQDKKKKKRSYDAS